MSETMQGRRLTEWPEGGLFGFAPGDYAKHPNGEWFARTPNGHGANLSAHEVTEHEDGTITVSPSILVSMPRDGANVELWHGFLERGVWRSC